jgi:VanZ family protein
VTGLSAKQATIATVAWVAGIFFSSSSLAGKWSEDVFRAISAVLFGQALRSGNPFYGSIHLLADKGFHVTMFTVLAILLWMSLRSASKKIAPIILIGAAVGSVSEYLQSFFPGRDPALKDVLINLGGTVLGTLIMMFFVTRSSGSSARTDPNKSQRLTASGKVQG